MLLPSVWTVLFCIFTLVSCTEDFYKVSPFIREKWKYTSNHAKLLGVDKSANEKDLKRAYRQLSKKYHPDKNPYATQPSCPLLTQY